jgi:predicted CXXCH cytochrome family protein
MKRTLFTVFAILAIAGVASAATVVGSRHDLRAVGGGTATGNGLTEVCVVCHTPHQATTANAQDPLWNHTGTSTAAFGVYASATLNATPTNIGGSAMGSQSVSMLCMSCHDGTISVLSMYNPPNAGTPTVTAIASRIDTNGRIISNSNVGTDLSDDHPVNFTYNAALVTADGGTGLADPTSGTVSPLLFAGTVQCASCHDVHDPTNTPFLRMSNAASALCLTCHLK